jgi:purine-nucleoside phosphorylase
MRRVASDHLTAQLDRAAALWEEWGWPRPRGLLVSGSGLAVDLLPARAAASRPLADLLPFPIHALPGHPLTVTLLGAESSFPVLYSRGRVHTYQGHTAAEAVFLVRLAALLGAGVVMQTNASGSLRREIGPGELVLVDDHINLIGQNPLRGAPPESWGPRFPDMTRAYDSPWRDTLLEIAARQGVRLHRGVYAALPGPSYETPAEVRMLERLGADLVGMSTVLEVIAARHMGLDNLVVSMVSNHAAGITEAPLEHDEVLAIAVASASRLAQLFDELLLRAMDAPRPDPRR